MTTVRGHERATDTSASVPLSITRRAMASVSRRARGVPTGTSARRRMSAATVAGTPSTRTVRAARTGLISTSQKAPAEDGDDREPPGRQQPRAAAHGGRARGEARAGGGEPDGPGRRGARGTVAAAPARPVLSAHPPGPRDPRPVPGPPGAGDRRSSEQAQHLRPDEGDVTGADGQDEVAAGGRARRPLGAACDQDGT